MQDNIIHRVLGVSSNTGINQRLLGHTNNAVSKLGHSGNPSRRLGQTKHFSGQKSKSPFLKELGEVVD